MQKSKRVSITHDCERGVRAMMPQSRAASSAGVGKKLLLARSIEDCPSHVALTVMHAYFAFFPTVWLLAVYATHHHKALLISNAIETFHVTHEHCSWHKNPACSHTHQLIWSMQFSSISLLISHLAFSFAWQCNPTRVRLNFKPKLQRPSPKFALHAGLI